MGNKFQIDSYNINFIYNIYIMYGAQKRYKSRYYYGINRKISPIDNIIYIIQRTDKKT